MALHLDKMQYPLYTVKNGVAVWGPLLSNVFITVDDFTEIFSQGRSFGGSVSIETQKILLEQHCQAHSITEYEFYCDA